MEIMYMPALNKNNIRGLVTFDRPDVLWEALGEGKGVVMLACHMDNWEWLGAALALSGFPLSAVEKPQPNHIYSDFMNELRKGVGQEIFSRGTSEILGCARAMKKKRMLGLIADQDGGYDGIFVPFLGKMASTPTGPAYFSRKFNAPIVPIFIVRKEGNYGHLAIVKDPIYYEDTGDRKAGITLYSNGVMIMEKCDKLVHDYFDFVKGVVDSPDLSLNISREILQHDRQLRVIGQNLEKKIKGELEKLMKDDRPKYEEFFRNFGTDIKCGVCDEYGRYKDFLRDLLVFYTSEEHQITLKEYVENMPESQKAIYFASSDSVKHAMSLPQCDQVRARGYELIYLTSPLDEMVLENLRDQDGHPFCNVVTEDLGFETEEEKKAADERDAENKDFLDFVQQSVGGDLAKVKISRKLETLPCCLTTEGNITLEMEKYFRHGPSEEMRKIRATRVLELNANHKAFAALKDAYENDKDKAKQLSKILASLAELMAGVEIDDPAEFVAEVSELF